MHRARMTRLLVPILAAPVLAAGCAGNPDRQTLAELRSVEPEMTEVRVEDGLDQAMLAYESFLEKSPKSALTPEAMRRLADLKIEKEYGILGDGTPEALPAPEKQTVTRDEDDSEVQAVPAAIADHSESDRDFERRATGEATLSSAHASDDLELPGLAADLG